MPGAIPLVDLTRQDPGITSEIEAAVARVLASGRYVLGPEKEAFDRSLRVNPAQGPVLPIRTRN